MTSSSPHKARSVPLAIVLLVLFDTAGFIGLWVALAVSTGNLKRFFIEGGVWMQLVALLVLAQSVAALLLGILHIHRRVPVLLYGVVPGLVLLAGVAGEALGVTSAFSALAQAAPDQKLAMWTALLSIASNPLIFAFFVAGGGGLSALAGCTMAAFVRRAPGAFWGAAAGTFGLGLFASLGVAGLGLHLSEDATWVRPVFFGVILLACAVMLALAAPGIRHLAAREKAGENADGPGALPLAITAAAGLALGLLAFAAALRAEDLSSALSAIASAPPDMLAAMLSVSIAMAQQAELIGAIAAAAGLVAALPLLLLALPSAPTWLGRHRLQAAAMLLLIAGLLGLPQASKRLIERRNQTIVSILTPGVPAGLKLPMSDAIPRPIGSAPVWLLKGDALVLHDSTDPWAPKTPGANPLLALPASTPGAALGRVTEGLREGGTRRVALLTSARGTDRMPPGLQRQSEAQLRSQGAVGELALLAMKTHGVIDLGLAEAIAPAEAGTHPGLDLLLELDGAALTLSGVGAKIPLPAGAKPEGPTLPPTPEGELDRTSLRAMLEQIRDAFPDEQRAYVHISERTSLQQLVDLADTAVYSERHRTLFPLLVWVTSPRRPAPPEAPPGPPEAPTSPGTPRPAKQGSKAQAPTVRGSLPRDVIAAVIAHHQGEVRYCYERQLQKNPGLAGRVDLRFIISATGAVATATASGTLPDDAVKNCLVTRAKRWRFPAPEGGGIVQVAYPFVFKGAP